MAGSTINFNGGNPFPIGPAGVHSAPVSLPASVTDVSLNLLDPNGDWINPTNAGGTFIYGIEYSPDGGTTWKILVSNGIGQPVGSVNPRSGTLPSIGISRSTGLTEAYGKQCRAFGTCSPRTITIAASATVTD